MIKVITGKFRCKIHGIISQAIKTEFTDLRRKDNELLSGVFCLACIIEKLRYSFGLAKLEEVKIE